MSDPGNMILIMQDLRRAPTRRHELDSADHSDDTDHTDQNRINLPCLVDLDHEL